MHANAEHCRECGDELSNSVEKARGYCSDCGTGALEK